MHNGWWWSNTAISHSLKSSWIRDICGPDNPFLYEWTFFLTVLWLHFFPLENNKWLVMLFKVRVLSRETKASSLVAMKMHSGTGGHSHGQSLRAYGGKTWGKKWIPVTCGHMAKDIKIKLLPREFSFLCLTKSSRLISSWGILQGWGVKIKVVQKQTSIG